LSSKRRMAAGGSSSNAVPLLTSSKLRELLNTLTGPREKFDDVVELALVRIADDLAMEVSGAAAQLASFRRSGTVEAKDVLYVAEHQFGMTGIKAEGEAHLPASKNAGGDSATDSEGSSPPKRGRRGAASTSKSRRASAR
jgi:hypothetical protein